MKILKWILIIIGILLTLLLVLINLAAPRFRTPDKKIEQAFSEAGIPFEIHRADYQGDPIRWVESGNLDAKTLVLFFHGAPGGFGDFSGYKLLTTERGFVVKQNSACSKNVVGFAIINCHPMCI